MTSKPRNKNINSIHIQNIIDEVFELLDSAYKNHCDSIAGSKTNHAKRTSHLESGISALCIMSCAILVESNINSITYLRKIVIPPRPDGKKNGIVDLYRSVINDYLHYLKTDDKIDDFIDVIVDYFSEIMLARNIIAHGYMFSGDLYYDESWNISGVDISPTTGERANKIPKDLILENIAINISPMSMCIFDCAIILMLTILLCKAIGANGTINDSFIKNGSDYISIEEWCNLVLENAPIYKINKFNKIKSDIDRIDLLNIKYSVKIQK